MATVTRESDLNRQVKKCHSVLKVELLQQIIKECGKNITWSPETSVSCHFEDIHRRHRISAENVNSVVCV